MSGTLKSDIRSEGDFEIVIGDDGSLSVEGFESEVITGQIASDGSMFSVLLRDISPNDNCNGAHTVTLTGVRR